MKLFLCALLLAAIVITGGCAGANGAKTAATADSPRTETAGGAPEPSLVDAGGQPAERTADARSPRTEPEPSGGSGLSLIEAVERSAEQIAEALPRGSRVALAAFESASVGLSDYLMEELTGALFERGIEVADRQNLEYLYREFSFQMSGAVSDEDVIAIGNFLAADMVITGSFTDAGEAFRYRTRAIRMKESTIAAVTRLDVSGSRETRRLIEVLARQTTAVSSAKYGVGEQKAPQSAGAFLDRGILFASRGDYDLAIADFNEAIKLAPNMAMAFYNRGRAFHKKGHNDFAVEDFTRTIQLNQTYAAAYIDRAVAYAGQEDFAKALADFDTAINLAPNDVRALTSRGDMYLKRGEFDKGAADYEKAIALSPTAQAYNGRGRAYFKAEKYEEAAADYTRAIELDSNYVEAYINRGYAYIEKRRESKDFLMSAQKDFTRVLALSPQNIDAYIGRGIATGELAMYYRSLPTYETALDDIQAALRIDPNSERAKRLLNRGRELRDNLARERARDEREFEENFNRRPGPRGLR